MTECVICSYNISVGHFELIISETGRKMVMHMHYPQFVALLGDKEQNLKFEIKYLDDVISAILRNEISVFRLSNEFDCWMRNKNLKP